MATKVKDAQHGAKKDTKGSEVVQDVEKEVKPFQAFLTKFNNDWVMNFSGALAYSLLMSMFPIAIAILSILGFVLGALGPHEKAQVLNSVVNVLPSQGQGSQQASQGVVDQINTQLAKNAGVLGIIAVILALFNGSRLFIQIEGFFGIIYHVRQRPFLRQNLMAFVMLLVFVFLIPVMTFAAALPTFVTTFLSKTPLVNLPGSGILFTLGGIIGGLLAAFLLFQAIYMIVPNQHISFRNSYLGSIVAAVALQVYLILFPLYVSHFLNSFAGPISLVILLVFFYYFAVILLLGAEVNAFFSEKVKQTPVDLVTMVHLTTSHMPKDPQQQQEQAAASHKNDPTGSTSKDTNKGTASNGANNTGSQLASLTSASKAPSKKGKTSSEPVYEHEGVKKVYVKPPRSRVAVIAEAVAGTGLAFLLEVLRLRRRRPR